MSVRAALELRLLVACFLVIPCAVSVYLISVTDSLALGGLSLAVMAGTALLVAACIWPAWLGRANSAVHRTATSGSGAEYLHDPQPDRRVLARLRPEVHRMHGYAVQDACRLVNSGAR